MKYDLQSHGFGWRAHLLDCFRKSPIQGDIYQFGVADGFSLQVIGHMMKEIPATPNYYGFDVFTGMPKEEIEPDKQRDAPGCFKLVEMQGATDLPEAMKTLQSDIESNMRPGAKLTLIQGLVQETLTDDLAVRYFMRPARYIDMDMDIYSPTKFALEWLVKSKLIVPGTVIGFDDWGQCPEHPIGSYGESRAWKEMGIKSTLLGETAHGQIAFTVQKI